MVENWYVKLYKAEKEEWELGRIQPYKIEGMTEKQEEALRTLAEQSGFKNLRGFASWMKAADLDYYDLIKIASPE